MKTALWFLLLMLGKTLYWTAAAITFPLFAVCALIYTTSSSYSQPDWNFWFDDLYRYLKGRLRATWEEAETKVEHHTDLPEKEVLLRAHIDREA